MPTDFSYIRYLAAKKSIDDRALNRHVLEALAQAVRPQQKQGPVTFLEVGCGIGTMVERLWDWEILTHADYTAIDVLPENIAEVQNRLPAYAQARGLLVAAGGEGGFTAESSHRFLKVTLEAIDFYDFASREAGRFAGDVLVAHAFLDLVDLDRALPRLLALLKPGGLFYFTLNFDGATIFLPSLDPDLDSRMEELYHGTMDDRRINERPSGSSLTGRLLFTALPRVGGRILAAGSSDWVVLPGPEGYPGDEAYFLHDIVRTVESALRGHPLLPDEALTEWAARRQEQIEQSKLVYIAHQLDFFGIKEG